MASVGQVHWQEGLFLQPHHLQLQQRQQQLEIAGERQLSFAWPYGMVELRISPDALENMMVRVDRLRAVMPSGLVVNVPENAELPALDIKQAFARGSGSFTISLGVPLWYPGRANTIGLGDGDDWRAKRIYRIGEAQVADENSGENPQPVQIRKINARLLLDEDDHSDLEVIPLLRIAHGAGQQVGLPRQDPAFIPPCFVLGGSTALRELLRDLANQVEASRKELVIQISRGGFSVDTMRGVQFEQMLRLRTLNRFSARLPHLVAAPSTTPFAMYLELRELLGELAALQPDRDPFDVPNYDHDNPAVAFTELSSRIRGLLRGTVASRFLQVPFNRDGRVLAAVVSDEQFNTAHEYFLGIKTRQDPRELAKLVEDPDRFQLKAKSMVDLRIWGVKLAEERHPPLELPSQGGLNYFRLNRAESQRMWDRIRDEKAMAIRWPDIETSDYAVSLYMTVAGENQP